MKVCFIAGTLGNGGAERQLLFMLRALKSEGIHTKLLCLTRGERYEKEIENLGVEVEWIGASQNRLPRLAKVISAVNSYRPDIVQSSHFYTNIYAALAGRLRGFRSIGAIRSNLDREMDADRVFGKWQVRLPQHLITNSETALNRAIDRGVKAQKIDFVRNVVEIPPMPEGKSSHQGVTILFVGRLGNEKQPEIFIKLASKLLSDLPETNLRFEIVGDGPRRGELETLANKYNLSKDRFRFRGEQSNIAKIYQNTDLLVLTSEYEGSPNVILEAMSFAIPVVAFRVGGVPEILNEKTGILVDPSNFGQLVESTTRLLVNPDLCCSMGGQGRSYVAANHSLDYLRKRLTGIYGRLLGNGR